MRYPDNTLCLIRDAKTIYGYIAFGDNVFGSDDWSERIKADDITPITPDEIVAGSMPLLDLIPLFRSHSSFFVLSGNSITHTVSFSDLDRLPFKLCLFSLILALESELVGVLADETTFDPEGTVAKEYLHLLPESRLAKAEELCRTKHKGRMNPRNILLCTTFIDKITMIVRSPDLFQLLPFQSRNAGEQFFKKIERLRNQIAHSDTIFDVFATPDELDSFVSDLKTVTDGIAQIHPSI